MYSAFQLTTKYLQYYLTASNGKGHGIHSPFIFHFITQILNDKQPYDAYEKVEGLRTKLLKDQTLLTIKDMGAGSSVSKTNHRTIASIAKNAAKPKKFGQLLFRMVNYYQPQNILELGTSLGITTSYLSFAKPGATLITLEGAAEIAAVARKNFETLELQHISIIEGNFDNTLATVINGLPSVDFAFIDGNHRREPTERYFHQLLPKIGNDAILIFDDIHWSREMEEAWETIKNHSSVRCTVDLFFIGIVFFRREFTEKQHFVIRF
ncbi:MAG TPA: class I SAM-dependent methyltransferase [Chitinophagaceae bacterium]